MTDDELKKALEDLTAQERKTASLRWTFLRGIVYGFGVFIGSILLVALFVWILSKLNTAPIIGDYVSRIYDIIKSKN
jgi:hypothetical protein